MAIKREKKCIFSFPKIKFIMAKMAVENVLVGRNISIFELHTV